MYDLYNPTPEPIWTEAWDITAHLLDDLADWSHANNIQFGIVLLPSFHELTPSTWKSHTKKWPEINHFSTRDAHTKAVQICKNSAPTLDIFDHFKETPELLYYPTDGHWTPKGHALAAEAVTPFVIDLYKPTIDMVE